MTTGATTTSAEVRVRLVEAVRLDLVGPDASVPSDARLLVEVLPEAPSQWYLTGFLAPSDGPEQARSDDETPERLDLADDKGGSDDHGEPEKPVARRAFFPSSMGLSFQVPAACQRLEATVEWGDYMAEDRPGSGAVWRRRQRTETVPLALVGAGRRDPVSVPNSNGLELVVVERAGVSRAAGAPARSLSIFLVNRRRPAEKDQPRDTAFAFQATLRLSAAEGFLARPDLLAVGDEDDRDRSMAALQYADVREYAVGHNASAAWAADAAGCREVRTTWLPQTYVDRVESSDLPSVTLGMEALAGAPDATAVATAVRPLIALYKEWIVEQERAALGGAPHKETRARLLADADRAAQRMEQGLAALAEPLVLTSFRLANRVVARAIRQRACHGKPDLDPEKVAPPAWRPFQLAFLLLNLSGLADPAHPDRRVVDLLFFPTGGGKTEAYLGLAAFAIALRRLRDPSPRSSGVTVLMRYTLRLLTLDQFGRAATLICALELERQKDPGALGAWPIEIGMWVGLTATPNRMGGRGDADGKSTARAKVLAFQREPKARPSPIPLETCPWCGTRFGPDSFHLSPDTAAPNDLRIYCVSRACRFTPRGQRDGLPIQAVDEPLYRRLPAFLIATVDKFASLPWVGASSALLGRANRHDRDGFYGDADPGRGQPLGGYLLPPALVIQDELHLVSGPLGTMAGLYETAIDALCGRPPSDGPAAAPKIVASTATVRRAQQQIQALFARRDVAVFPPPGPNRRDTFFSQAHRGSEAGGRLYLGVAAQGRNLKVVLLRTYLALLAAGRRASDEARRAKQEPSPADPYLTLVGYFNTLRELGGSRRIIEDEVRARLSDYGTRRRRVEPADLVPFADRKNFKEPRELTSREPTHRVADTKRCLDLAHGDGDHVDVALATNMISVGLDIKRLGLMVVTGQPKSAAEYIQATSRVGREHDRPGLVVTLLNVNRARDRSHYERFSAWHDAFYRAVEATSVTPFSPRAIDRALASVVVALARHGHPALTRPRGAEALPAHRHELDFVADAIAARGAAHAPLTAEDAKALTDMLRARTTDLLDAWASIATDRGQLQYQREVGEAPPLLRDPLDPQLEKLLTRERKFRSHRSLRDVEPNVLLRMAGTGDDA